jgi:hypothetical protein
METQKVSIAMVAVDVTDLDGCAVAGTPIRVQSQGVYLGELRMAKRDEMLIYSQSDIVCRGTQRRQSSDRGSDVDWDCLLPQIEDDVHQLQLYDHRDIGEHLENLQRHTALPEFRNSKLPRWFACSTPLVQHSGQHKTVARSPNHPKSQKATK